MNILPHKIWHVRRKDNIAVVKADEAQYKEWYNKTVEQSRNAESESKLNQLRKKIGIEDIKDADELLRSKGESNKEYEKEKKLEQEKYEKQVGILTGLGQSVTDSKSKIWYLEHPDKHKSKECKKRNFEIKEDPMFKLVNCKKSEQYKPKKQKHFSSHNIDEMRQQRLLREAKERKRQEELFSKHKGKQ